MLLTLISEYNKANNNFVVYLLWGKNAQSKKEFIKHGQIFECPHPSPLSARTGFFGCKHFSKCNQYLKTHNKNEINWQINDK